MNHVSRLSVCAVLLAVTPIALGAPDTVTLTISGKVLPGTCTLAAPAIMLDPVGADEIVDGDNKLKAGALNFTGCVGVSKATLSFDGTAASGDPERWENTAPSDAATGVSVALLAGASGSSYLKKGDTGIDVPVTGTTASYPLRAGYYVASAAAAGPGDVRAEIVVTADYQ